MVELLSPAGNPESFYYAINAGANAVYLGLDLFSARKNAENFTRDNLPFFIQYAHISGVKVYVALNTIVADKELDEFFTYLKFCNDNGVDGVILQDVFLGKYIHDKFPELELHLSTQAGVTDQDGASLAKKFGFKRVVLARETPLSLIKEIAKIIEVEVFIQGALCTAFSGQCYMSGFAGNFSGNRGLCKQPCRKKYRLYNDKYDKTGYAISLADLSVNDKLNELLKAGVHSLKIEGRMRKPSYVYYATKYYRDLLDGKNPSISPLSRSFKRGNYTYGLAFGQDKNLISDKVQSHIGEAVGVVSAVKKNGFTLKNPYRFNVGDAGKILRGGYEVGSFQFLTSGNATVNGQCSVGDTVTITSDAMLEKTAKQAESLVPVNISVSLLCNKKPQITVESNNIKFVYTEDFLLEKANDSPLSENDIVACFKKCDKYPFAPKVTVSTDGVFLAKSGLNSLRRACYERLVNRLSPLSIKPMKDVFLPETKPVKGKSIAVISDDFSGLKHDFDVAVFSPLNYADKNAFDLFFSSLRDKNCKKFLYLPAKLDDNGLIEALLSKFDGLYCEGLYGIALAKKLNILCILGSGLNVYNRISESVLLNYVYDYVISKEISSGQKTGFSGYYYSGGSLKVMDLYYCPFGKNCNACLGCDYSTLDDGERKFILRRVKAGACYFEVYNPYPLLTDGGNKAIINLIGLNKSQKEALLINAFKPINAKNAFDKYTTGHSKKPLL